MNIQKLKESQKVIAVVGASNNPEKYGFKVYQTLKQNGFTVIPVNLKETEIQGDKAYNYLKDFDGEIELIVMVTPPSVSLEVLTQALAMKIMNVWFQPGSENSECLEFAKKHRMNVTKDACIIIRSNEIT